MKCKYNLKALLLRPLGSVDENYPRRFALRVAIVYVILGASWILFSDKILEAYFPELITLLSMIKGWVYVVATGIVLFFIMLFPLKKINSISQTLSNNYHELSATYEELHASEEELEAQLQNLAQSEERYRLVSEATNDAIWDERYGVRYFSERWYKITGYSKEEIAAMDDWMDLIHHDDIGRVRERLEWCKKNRNPHYSCEYRLKCKNGEYIWILSRALLIFDDKGEIIRSAGSHTDITNIKRYQEQLRHLAFHDFLTGLPNRISFYNILSDFLTGNPEKKMALLFIDIDNFKYINDTLGHMTGDELVAGIGKRFTELMSSDRSVYRISGDEFVILLHQYESIEEVYSFADKVVHCFTAPFILSGSRLYVSASIGISLFPEHGNDADKLLKCADMAMYKAKTTSRGKYVLYSQDMDRQLSERLTIENQLRSALDKNEFELYYQPQIDISTGKVRVMEALLRWRNDLLGFVPPLRFIEIAEETHLIAPIGNWVLENSCRFLKELHSMGYTDLRVSVNVSVIQLMQQDFTERIMDILAQTGLSPSCLELEVTESVFIDSFEDIRTKIEYLMSQGITIALDDFGKGYSSLNYLTQMPISVLKIDKSFIDNVDITNADKSLTSMMIVIGRKLGLTVVAEGVETEKQLGFLKMFKCDRVQGYYFSKPLPRNDLIEFLRSRQQQYLQ